MADDESANDGASSDLNIIDVRRPTTNPEDICTCGLCPSCTCAVCKVALSIWLDAVLSPKLLLASLNQLDTMWNLLAHRHSCFSNLVNELAEYRAERQCGVAWPPGNIAYRCHTCSSVLTMALCADCFRSGDHTGHDYNMFKSRSGGACDCGCSLMKEFGNCRRHDQEAKRAGEPIPDSLICTPRRLMPRLIHRLAFQLRRSHVDLTGETDIYLDFLSKIANSGAILRTLMIDAMVSEEIYSSQIELLTNHPDKEVARRINEGIKKLKRERKGLGAFKLSASWGLKKINAFCDYQEPTCFVDELMFWVVIFEFPQKLVCFLLGFLMDDRYKRAFAKAFVNHYPRLVMLLAGQKGETRMRQLRDSFEQLSRRIMQVSVQIYNVKTFTLMLCEEDQTLHTIIYCLRLAIEGAPSEGLRGVLKFNPLCQNNSNTPRVVCCDNPIIRDRYLESFAEDLNAILDFKEAAKLLIDDKDLLNTWLGMLRYFQTMSPYKRELTEHTPYETGPHVSVFSIEADFCLTPLWSILNRLRDTPSATVSLLQFLHTNLTLWFHDMNIAPNSVLDPYYMSFHIPLHRMFAATLRHLLFIQKIPDLEIHNSMDMKRYVPYLKQDHTTASNLLEQRSTLTKKEFLKILLLHPLQALTLYHETRSSMWTRNGLMTINQAVTYVHYAYCYSTVDLDMFLLRYSASELEPNYFLKILMTRFHAWKWLSFKSNNLMSGSGNSASLLSGGIGGGGSGVGSSGGSGGGDARSSLYSLKFSISPEQVTLMVENSLVVLIQLLTLSLHSNISEREQIKQEMIALISVVDRSYSFLTEMLPNRNLIEHNVSDTNFESLLDELTNYKPAQHGIGGDLRQGCYTLKGEIWDEEYDPMQVQHRFYQKRDYQLSLERFFQHSKLTGKLEKRFHPSTLWPPLKIPKNIANFGRLDLTPLLTCPALIGLIYSILYKNLYIADVPDAIMAYTMHLLEMALRKEIVATTTPMTTTSSNETKMNPSFKGRYCYSRLRSCPAYFGSKGEAQIKGNSLYSVATNTLTTAMTTTTTTLSSSQTHSSNTTHEKRLPKGGKSGRDDNDDQEENDNDDEGAADKGANGLFPVVRHALDLAFDTTWFPFSSVRDNCLVFVENVFSMPTKEFESMLRYETRYASSFTGKPTASQVTCAPADGSKGPRAAIWVPEEHIDGDNDDVGNDDDDDDDDADSGDLGIDDNYELGYNFAIRDEDDNDDEDDDDDDDDDADDDADDDDEEDDDDDDGDELAAEDEDLDDDEVARGSSHLGVDLANVADIPNLLESPHLSGIRGRRFLAREEQQRVEQNAAAGTQDRATNTRSYWLRLHAEAIARGNPLPQVMDAEQQQQPTAPTTTSQNLTRTTYTNTTTQSRSMVSRQVRSVFSAAAATATNSSSSSPPTPPTSTSASSSSLRPQEQMYWQDDDCNNNTRSAHAEAPVSSATATVAASTFASNSTVLPVGREQSYSGSGVSGLSLSSAQSFQQEQHEQPMNLVESTDSDSAAEMISWLATSSQLAPAEPTGLAAIALAAERLTYEVSSSSSPVTLPTLPTTTTTNNNNNNNTTSVAPQDHTYSAREVPMELEETTTTSLPVSQSTALSLLPLQQQQQQHHQATQIYPENLVTERRAMLTSSDPRLMIAGSASAAAATSTTTQPLALELLPRSSAERAAQTSHLTRLHHHHHHHHNHHYHYHQQQSTRHQQQQQQEEQSSPLSSAQPTAAAEATTSAAAANSLSEVDIQARFMGFFQGRLEGSERPSSRATFRQRQMARRGGYRASVASASGSVAPFAVHNLTASPSTTLSQQQQQQPPPPPPPPPPPSSSSNHRQQFLEVAFHHQQDEPLPQSSSSLTATSTNTPPGSSSLSSSSSSSPQTAASSTTNRLTGTTTTTLQRALLLRSLQKQQRRHHRKHQLLLQKSPTNASSSSSTAADRKLHQGESLLSLLLRLHSKYSQRANSFQYNELRAKRNSEANRSRIGDGLHFVNIVLDLICNSDRRSRAALEQLQHLIWLTDRTDGHNNNQQHSDKEVRKTTDDDIVGITSGHYNSTGIDIKTNSPFEPKLQQQQYLQAGTLATPQTASSSSSAFVHQNEAEQQQLHRPMSPNERRRKAKEFQRRLMADFASKQRAFIEKYEAKEEKQPLSSSSSTSLPSSSSLSLLSDKVVAATAAAAAAATPDEEPINLSSKLDHRQQQSLRSVQQQQQQLSYVNRDKQLASQEQQRQQLTRQLDKRPLLPASTSMDTTTSTATATTADECETTTATTTTTKEPMSSTTREEETTMSQLECCICGLDNQPQDLANPLGQVVLLQSSSVWGHSHLKGANERPLPCEEAEQVRSKEQTYAKYLERRIDLLCEHFSQSSWLDSINIGAEGGVHVQSCGHYLHIECHQSYIKSLDQEDRLRARTDTDEFLCPVCRQLANSVLPILSNNNNNNVAATTNTTSNASYSSFAALTAPKDSLVTTDHYHNSCHQDEDQVSKVAVLLNSRLTPNQKELHSSAAFCSHLTKATGPQYRLVRSSPCMHSLFLFLTSIARTNLETELVVRHTASGKGISSSASGGSSTMALNSARRSCFKLLFRVLALNAQTLINDQWFTCDHIWSHLTHRVDEKNRLSVKPLNSEVPLLLRDPIAMLLQFLFAISSKAAAAVEAGSSCSAASNEEQANFTCLVQILFNLAAVQSIALLLSYLPTATFHKLVKVQLHQQRSAENNLRALVLAVARYLEPLLQPIREEPLANPAVRSLWLPLANHFEQQQQQLNDKDQSSSNEDAALKHQWSLLKLAIKLALLPYLRAAALLQHHLIQGAPSYPADEQLDEPHCAVSVENDFRALVTCLKLTSCQDDKGEEEEEAAYLLDEVLSRSWPVGVVVNQDNLGGGGGALLADWCNELMRFGQDFSIAARSLLICRPLTNWRKPALMKLPRAFDDVFMFYYRKKCTLCQQVPKDVAVCLVCGAPICFRVSCCKDRSRSRQVHSQHCGANTAVFLAVHTSSIVVIRGSRACVWGSVYLDAHDEEDNGLQRGKPLYLVPARFKLLEEQWLTHSFDHTCGKRWIYLQENQ